MCFLKKNLEGSNPRFSTASSSEFEEIFGPALELVLKGFSERDHLSNIFGFDSSKNYFWAWTIFKFVNTF